MTFTSELHREALNKLLQKHRKSIRIQQNYTEDQIETEENEIETDLNSNPLAIIESFKADIKSRGKKPTRFLHRAPFTSLESNGDEPDCQNPLQNTLKLKALENTLSLLQSNSKESSDDYNPSQGSATAKEQSYLKTIGSLLVEIVQDPTSREVLLVEISV